MANKVNVDLDLNVQGYVQGMDQATQSTKAYESETRKVSDATGNFRKEFSQAKKDVLNLATAYRSLTDEERKSPFGKELAKQLNDAKQKAAKYLDIQSDIQQELKNLASDTATFDSLAQGMNVFMQTASAAAGALATLTGDEKDAQRAVAAFTTAQSTLNAVTAIQNALQEQSALRIGLTNIQKWAAAKASEAEAAATGKATIAQKLYNSVAKSNPYVLLLSAIVAVTAAVGGYILATHKAADAAAELEKNMHEASINGQKDAQQEIVKLDLLYKATQDTSLSVKEREAAVKKLQDQYPGYFNNMSKEQIMLGQASEKYRQLRDDIIAAAKAKAYEQKITSLSKELVEVEDKLETAQKALKNAEAAAHSYDNSATSFAHGAGQINMALVGMKKNSDAYDAASEKVDNLTKKQNELNAAIDKYTDRSMALQGNVNRLESGTTKSKTSGGNKNTKQEVDAVTNSIADLEKQISTLQELAKKGVLPKELRDPAKFKATLQILQKQLKDLKVEWGFEEPETKLQELQAKIDAAKHKYVLAVEANDEQAKQAARDEYYAAKEELDQYKLSIEIEPKLDTEKIQKKLDEIKKITQDALNPQDLKNQFDFSYLPDGLKKAADSMLKDYERIGEARKKLEEIMNDPNATDEQIASAQHGLETLNETWTKLNDTMTTYTETNNKLKELNEQSESVKKTMSSLGDVTGSLGSVFKSLGADAAASAMQVISSTAQMITQVIPQIIKLIAAKEAESMAAGMAGAAAVPFPGSLAAIATIISTILSTIATIASVLNGAERHAGGGIVGGSSYAGDKIMAFLNSGEMILNSRQQKNLFDLLDSGAMPNANGVNVQVTGVIKGTDIILVQKNTNKVLRKTGNNISF